VLQHCDRAGGSISSSYFISLVVLRDCNGNVVNVKLGVTWLDVRQKNSSCPRKPAKANKQAAARHMSPKEPFLYAIALHISAVNSSFLFTELASILLIPSSTACTKGDAIRDNRPDRE